MPRFTSTQITNIIIALIGAIAAVAVPLYIHLHPDPKPDTTAFDKEKVTLEKEKVIAKNLVTALREQRYQDVPESFSSATRAALPAAYIKASCDTVFPRLGQPLSTSEPSVIQAPQGDVVIITQRFTKGNLIVQTVFDQDHTQIMQLWVKPYYY